MIWLAGVGIGLGAEQVECGYRGGVEGLGGLCPLEGKGGVALLEPTRLFERERWNLTAMGDKKWYEQ